MSALNRNKTVEELRKKVRTQRTLICVLLFLASFQTAFLYLISQGRIPSSLVIIKEVTIKENNNTNQTEPEDEDSE